jgi:hypothetical protein
MDKAQTPTESEFSTNETLQLEGKPESPEYTHSPVEATQKLGNLGDLTNETPTETTQEPSRDGPSHSTSTFRVSDRVEKEIQWLLKAEDQWGDPGWELKWKAIKEEIPDSLKRILESTFASVLRKCREYASAAHSKSRRSQSEAEVRKGQSEFYKEHAENVVKSLFAELANSRAQAAATEAALKEAAEYRKAAHDTYRMAWHMHTNRDIIANVLTRTRYAQGGNPGDPNGDDDDGDDDADDGDAGLPAGDGHDTT